MKIVLFDIDGTLLQSDGAGRAAMESALYASFGTAGPASYRYGGKTDKLIVRESMRLEGFDDATIDERMPVVLAAYLNTLHGHLSSGTFIAESMPGVHSLLDAVDAHPSLVLGLLTGNLVEGAGIKLGAVGIEHGRFRVGAYGSDHEERPMLPPIAQARARAHLGCDVSGEQLVIIGDTPYDVTCGRGVGARAIAVATGGYSFDDLVSYEPVAAFTDLADTPRVMEAILDA